MADNLKDILLDKDPKNQKPATTSLKDILKQDLKQNAQSTDIQLGQFGVGESKYDVGITPENVSQLGEVRGQRQPSALKLGAGLANAVTQTGLDIVKDASYLFDIENYTDFTKSSEEGFSNWLADSMQSIEDKVKLPVYRTKASEGFSPLSAGWWGENIPSIVSTVSMMIPAEGAVMGLSKIGKMMGGNKLVKGIENLSGVRGISDAAKGLTGAVISRQMENIMEGGQTFQDTFKTSYEKLKSEQEKNGLSDQEIEQQAKVIAGEAAANNYKLNWANLVTDIPQYMLLHKNFKQTLKDQQFSAKELAKTVFQESAEEGYQFITNEETKRAALIKHNVLADDKTDLTERLGEYAKEGDFWTSVFLGGLGGGIFSGVAAYNNNRNLSKVEQQYDFLTKLHAATVKGDEETFNRVSDQAFSNELIGSIKEDNLDSFKEMLDKTVEVTDNSEDRVETQKRLNERNKIIDFAENLKTNLSADNTKSPELRALELGVSVEQKLTSDRLSKINTKISSLQAQDHHELQLVDPTLYQFKIAKLTYEAIKEIPSLQAKAVELSKNLQDSYTLLLSEGNFKSREDIDKALVSTNDKELINLYKNKELDNLSLAETRDILYNLSTEEGKIAYQKHVDEVKEQLEKEKKKAEQESNPPLKPEDLKDVESKEQELNTAKEEITNEVVNNPGIVNKEEVLNFVEEGHTKDKEALNKQRINIVQDTETKESIITNSGDGVVPDLSTKERHKIEESLKNSLNFTSNEDREVSPKGDVITLGDLIVPAAHSIAYLSKDYKEEFAKSKQKQNVTYRKLSDISEDLNSEMQEPMLLSNTQYQVGDKLFLEVDKAFNVVKPDKTVISYENLKDNTDLIPIKVTNEEGKIVGYLHTMDWINPTNVADSYKEIKNNVEKQRALLSELREMVVANGRTEVEITDKTFGKLSGTLDKKDRKVSEIVKNPNVKFVVGKDNKFATGLESFLTGEQPVNKDVTSGLVYMIVDTPVADKTVALPVYNTKVSNQIADTLTNAADIFFKQNKALANEVLIKTGFDILTVNGLRKFFNLYVTTNSFDQSDLNNNVGRDDKLFLDVVGNGIKFGTGGGIINDIGNIKYWKKDEFAYYIKNAWTSVFLSHMDKPAFKYAFITNDGKVEGRESTYSEFVKDNTTTNILEYELPDGSYTYFVQSVITFGSKSEKSVNESQKTTVAEKADLKEKPLNKPTQLGELDENSTELEDESPVNLSTKQVKAIALESSLISGFSASRQTQVIGIMNSYILKQLKDKGKQDTFGLYGELRDIFANYAEYYKDKPVGREFSKILANYPEFVNQSKARLLLFNVKQSSTGDQLGIEDLESNNEKVNFDDGATFQIDSKEGMSGRLKQFLSFVPSAKKSYLGLDAYMPYDEVVNYLSGQLAGLDASLIDVIAKLDELSKNQPWIPTVKEQLLNAPEQVRNEFVQWATKHYTGFKIVNLIEGPDGSKTIKTMDSDQNSVVKLLLAKWYNQLRSSNLVKETTPGNLIIDNAIRKSLVDKINSIDKSDLEAVREWLSKIGIDVATETLQSIKDNPRLPFDKQFTDANGIFKTIIENLSKPITEEDTFEINNPMLDNSGIRKLAAEEIKHTPTYFSNSFKSGENKTIYSYSANKFFIKQFYRLKHNKDGYLSKLGKISFSSTSEWLKKLSNPNSYFSQVFDYFYVDTLKVKNDGTTLASMSSREHELTKLGMFQNQNNGSEKKGRIAHFLFPTMSDKSTMVGITALKQEVGLRFEGESYTLSNETIDAVYTSVEAEYKRVRSSYNIQNTVDGYNPNKFYLFEELNYHDGLWDESGNTKVLKPLTPEIENILKGVVESHIKQLIEAKKTHWEDLGISKNNTLLFVDKTYEAFVKGNLSAENKNNANITTYAAADFVVNYLIANANSFQLFIGDPAQFAKKTLEDTWINIGKRLAGEIAPGLELADSKNNKYTQAFVKDNTGKLRISSNYEQIVKLIGKEFAEPYADIDSTDAQEWTTLAEHLYVLEKSGKISPEQTKEFLDKESSGTLSKADYNVIFQPVKPVYVNTQIEASLDLNRKIYIKSSSFPLIKGITPELDKLLAQMISKEIDRIAFKTATKVGGPKNFVDIFDEEGKIKDNIEFETLTLDREGFRIQQEVPFDESKEAINRGTQESKLLFANILDTKGFEYDGKTLTGKELQDKYNDLNRQLFTNAKEELFRELEYKEGKFNIFKVQDMLIREASTRGWSQNEIDSLKLVKADEFTEVFALPLWSSTSASRIEALLNSLVDNRVRKQKMRGNSFVLGSEEGFTTGSGIIVYTPSYDPTKGLQPQRIVDGKVLPAQILIPNKLRDKNGKIVDIQKIGLENIDPDLLKVFGFRIPTQGLNSMTYAEIVGFLPGNTDLVIGPKDWTKQMGSDFDIDKLYTYMYNSELQNGKLQKYNFLEKDVEELYYKLHDKATTDLLKAFHEEWAQDLDEDLETFKYKFKQREIQNKLLDVHFSVMSNPNHEVQEQILHPLGFGKLPELSKRVDKARHKRLASSFKATKLSDTYQKEKYLKARGGKDGTGVKSLDSVFTAISQGKELYLRIETQDGEIPLSLVFGDANGDAISLGDISSKDSISKHPKLNTVAAYQSAAVDNEKEQILEKINSNNYTFDTERALAAVGYTEEFIVPLTSQDIVFEYTSEMSRAQDSLNTTFISKPEEKIIDTLIDKYAKEGGLSSEIVDKLIDSNYPLTQKEMWDAIEEGNKDPEYYKTQIRSIVKFNKAREIGKEISNIQLTVNTDSSGVSPSLIESNAKEEKVEKLSSNKYIANANKLLDNTINGYATNDALKVANELWSGLFPYGQERVQQQFEEIQKIIGKDRLSTDERYAIFNHIKSFIYSQSDLGLETDSIESTRKRLFFDTVDNKSLASQIKELQKTSKNPFVLRLIPEVDVTGTKPSLIKYNAGAGENLDELSVYQGFTDLMVNSTTRTLAQELVTYFYLSGGIQQAIQFGKYIPNAYLTNIEFAKSLRDLSFDNEALLGINDFKSNYYDVSNFTKQWIQHNPNRAIRLKEDLSQIKNIKKDNSKVIKSFEIDPVTNSDILVTRQNPETGKTFEALPEFVSLNFKLYQYTGNGKYVQIDTLGTFGYSEYNQGKFDVTSDILANKANTEIIVEPKTDNRDTAEKISEDYVDNAELPIDRIVEYDIEKGIEATLNVITKSANPLHVELAKQFLKNLKQFPKVNLTVTDKHVVGVYYYGSNTISVNPNHVNSDNEFERAILHELVHHFTGHTINAEHKTPEQERIVNSLKALQKVLKDKIAQNPAQQEAFERFIKNFREGKEISEYQVSKFYGAMELREFATMAMTDMEFQKILNNIPFTAEKTILDRFIELITNILGTLGFPVKENSALKASIENIVELINLGNQEFVEEEKMTILDESPANKDLPDLKPC